jgi:hypothetical protein
VQWEGLRPMTVLKGGAAADWGLLFDGLNLTLTTSP